MERLKAILQNIPIGSLKGYNIETNGEIFKVKTIGVNSFIGTLNDTEDLLPFKDITDVENQKLLNFIRFNIRKIKTE